jgi:hypothetical protein
MAGETTPKIHLSFENLGLAIQAYDKKAEAHNSARFINLAYDDEHFATISDQALRDWKQEFPRVDDKEIERLQHEHDDATTHLIGELGLESADILPALLEVYHNEETRRTLERNLGHDERDPYRTAITTLSANINIEPRDMIAGAIAMSKITGETCMMHAGIMTGKTYNYAYATVEPTYGVDDVVAQFTGRGLEISSASVA